MENEKSIGARLRLSKLSQALLLAVKGHAGQVDKAGEPYILHPLRVMLGCKSEQERIVAVLHDVVEDCEIPVEQIEKQFGREVAEAVGALSRNNGEAYEAFIERCGQNRLACAVKLGDLADNMHPARQPSAPKPEDIARQIKYAAARKYLMGQWPA